MPKRCPGKYHGSGIKYINDDEKYCKVCKQHYDCNKKTAGEIVGGVVIGILSIVGAILGVNSKRKK